MRYRGNDDRDHRSLFGESSYRNWSFVALAALWALYVFVFYEILPYAASDEIVMALVISGAFVLLFNAASIIAMPFQSRAKQVVPKSQEPGGSGFLFLPGF
jgi:hypothetical protein